MWRSFCFIENFHESAPIFKDSHNVCRGCEKCQRLGNISRRHMMPLNAILVVDLFDVWGIDFMRSFPIGGG